MNAHATCPHCGASTCPHCGRALPTPQFIPANPWRYGPHVQPLPYLPPYYVGDVPYPSPTITC